MQFFTRIPRNTLSKSFMLAIYHCLIVSGNSERVHHGILIKIDSLSMLDSIHINFLYGVSLSLSPITTATLESYALPISAFSKNNGLNIAHSFCKFVETLVFNHGSWLMELFAFLASFCCGNNILWQTWTNIYSKRNLNNFSKILKQ